MESITFGIWSIVPPIVAVVLAILTKRVILSLFISIYVGALIYAGGNPLMAVSHSFDWIVEVMMDSWNARFLLLVTLLGTGAAFMYKIGGSGALTHSLRNKITTTKRAQTFSYIISLACFFNDYANTVITGNASREMLRDRKVSTEKFAYQLDSTAAAMATIGPVSDWIGFQVSLISAAFVTVGLAGNQAYSVFLKSIPFNFYAILTVIAVPLLIWGKDFGPMAKAELRARKTGELIAKGSTPLSSVESDLGQPTIKNSSVWNFILPIIALVGIAMWAMWYTGGGPEGKSIMDALADTQVDVALNWGAFAMVVVGMVLGIKSGLKLEDCEETILLGFKTMLPAIVIMILAWSIGLVGSKLGLADFVVREVSGWMTSGLLPIILFITGMFISVSTGTSWGTMTLLTPIGIPLSFAIGGLPLVQIAIGAIFAGAIFGDHCSPISDTTVMSSIFAGSDHIAHVSTQIPYAIVVATISAVLYILSPIIKNGFVLLTLGIVVLVITLRLLGYYYQNKHFTEEERALLNEQNNVLTEV